MVGGFFALNGGFIDEGLGQIFYFAPDSIEWECLEMGYTDFIYWACTGDLNKYYDTMRWNGWESYIANMNGDQAISIYPPLFSKEAQSGIENCSKKPVPIKEIWDTYNQFKK